jgi:hypothetical protein
VRLPGSADFSLRTGKKNRKIKKAGAARENDHGQFHYLNQYLMLDNPLRFRPVMRPLSGKEQGNIRENAPRFQGCRQALLPDDTYRILVPRSATRQENSRADLGAMVRRCAAANVRAVGRNNRSALRR